MDPIFYLVVAVLLVVAGVVGTVVPVLPGTLLVFGGLFIAAWAQDFDQRMRKQFAGRPLPKPDPSEPPPAGSVERKLWDIAAARKGAP